MPIARQEPRSLGQSSSGNFPSWDVVRPSDKFCRSEPVGSAIGSFEQLEEAPYASYLRAASRSRPEDAFSRHVDGRSA